VNRIWTIVSSTEKRDRTVTKFIAGMDSKTASAEFLKKYPDHILEAIMPGEINVITYDSYP